MRYIILSIIFMIMFFSFSADAQQQAINVAIGLDGIVTVEMNVNLDEGLNSVSLPIEPLPESLAVSIDGLTLIPMYENSILYVFSPKDGVAKITYLADISIDKNIFMFEVRGGSPVRLTLKPNIVLLSVPEKIVKYEYVNEDLVIEFHGPQKIEYVVKRISETASNTLSATTTTVTPPSVSGTETTSSMVTETPGTVEATTTSSPIIVMDKDVSKPRIEEPLLQFLIVAGLAIFAAVVMAAIFVFARKMHKGSLGDGLSRLDIEILKLVRNSGGAVMQGDLQAVLKLPKTTLWRHVRKLEKLGYIEIVKEGPFNRLILIRDID